jgi:hypothetical protein
MFLLGTYQTENETKGWQMFPPGHTKTEDDTGRWFSWAHIKQKMKQKAGRCSLLDTHQTEDETKGWQMFPPGYTSNRR